MNWDKKWLVDFNAGKTQLISFDRSNNTGSIDVKIDGSVLEEKSSYKMLGLTSSSKLDWGSYIISSAKTASKKIGAFIYVSFIYLLFISFYYIFIISFFLLRLIYISINLDHV